MTECLIEHLVQGVAQVRLGGWGDRKPSLQTLEVVREVRADIDDFLVGRYDAVGAE